ncbi:MAG: glycosyltransferase [Lysobacterales bacterium]
MSTGLRYSLVVMTRNRPGPLVRCLESIERLRWDGERPEVIVVDDGSDPPVRLAPQDLPSLKLVHVRLEHSGVAAARNAGVAKAGGDCVAFIADDYVLPEPYLEDIDGFFSTHPEGQVISHNIDPRGPLLLRRVQQLYFDLAIGQEVPPDQAGRDLIHSYTLPASRAAMFRRGVFERVGVFNESLQVGEDGEFGQRLARAGIPVYLFRDKRVAHFDAHRSLDYIRQRLRYGRSYVRSGVSGLPLEAMTRPAFLARMLKMLRGKLRLWWQVSGRLRLRRRYLVLSPFLVLFLCCFYYGAYAEFRDLRKTGFKGVPGR